MSRGDNLENNSLNMVLTRGTPSLPHVGRGDGVPHFVIRYYQQITMPRRHHAPGEHAAAALQNAALQGNPVPEENPAPNQPIEILVPFPNPGAPANAVPEDNPDVLQNLPPPLNPVVFVNVDLVHNQVASGNPAPGERRALSQNSIRLGDPEVHELRPGPLHHALPQLHPGLAANNNLRHEPPGDPEPGPNCASFQNPVPLGRPLPREDSAPDGGSSPAAPEDEPEPEANPVQCQDPLLEGQSVASRNQENYIHVADILPRASPDLEQIMEEILEPALEPVLDRYSGLQVEPDPEQHPVAQPDLLPGPEVAGVPAVEQNQVPQENPPEPEPQPAVQRGEQEASLN
ncbi:uncharacterized protein ACB058_000835 [Synchiropus picturatus]